MAGDDEKSNEEPKEKRPLPKHFPTPEELDVFDQDYMSDDEIVEAFVNAYHIPEMTDELRELIVRLGRRQLFVAAKEAFLNVHYNVAVTPDSLRELKEYLQLVVDTLMPTGTPERIALEIAWQDKIIIYLRQAQAETEAVRKRQGHPDLMVPKKGLILPGANQSK